MVFSLSLLLRQPAIPFCDELIIIGSGQEAFSPNSIDRDREENAHDRKKGLVFFPKASSGSNTPTREELLSEYKLAVRTYSSSITLYKLSYRIGGGFSFLPNW